MRLVFTFSFFLFKQNVHHDGSTSKANALNMKAAVCTIPYLEPRGGGLDRSDSHWTVRWHHDKLVCSIKTVRWSFFSLDYQRSCVGSSPHLCVLCMIHHRMGTFWPPTTLVHSLISQILHIKSIHCLGVFFLVVKVAHRFAAMIFNIKSIVN